MLSRRSFLTFLIVCFSALLAAQVSFAQNTVDPLVAAARKQIGVTTIYNGAYTRIPYPNGDVPQNYGVCTDVVIRAYRDARQYDLQKAVHEDMSTKFSAYPKNWGLSQPDSNIDHRRVPNLQTFLRRHHAELPKDTALDTLRPGDLVTMMLPRNLPHIVIVSDRKAEDGRPFVIHNVGRGTQEEDFLGQYPITGFYRYHPR